MPANIRERLQRNLAYMKEMVIGDSLRFKSGRFVQCANLSNVSSQALGSYYVDYRSVVTHHHLWTPMAALDANGVVTSDFSPRGLESLGVRYLPVGIAQYALGNFELLLDTDDDKYRRAFLAQVDWLMENAKVTVYDTAVWEHDYNFTSLDMEIPWISAIAQGQIISVLLRAYQLTDERKYLDTAERTLRSFNYSTAEEGVTWSDESGLCLYEEYPSRPPSHVLNGHIWAMLGLYDFYRVTGSKEALDLFNAGSATVEKYLPCFDTGYWSKYDLVRKPGYAPVRYHCYHIELLKILYKITGAEIYRRYEKRWNSYLSPMRKARFAVHVASSRLQESLGNSLGSRDTARKRESPNG